MEMGDSISRDRERSAASTRARDGIGQGRESAGSGAFRFDREREDESVADLVSDLAHQGGHLAEQQSRLIQAEVTSAIGDLKESIGAFSGAAVLGIASLGVLLMAVSFLLGSVMPLWLGTLIVGVVSVGIAYALCVAGRKKLQTKSMTLDRTREMIERAPSAVTGNESEARRGR
jgi:hypothetical protein